MILQEDCFIFGDGVCTEFRVHQRGEAGVIVDGVVDGQQRA